jgi:glycolate oxidase FAD binding subunit
MPKAAVTVELPCALTEAAEVAARVLGGPTEPAALEWTSDDVLLLRLEGTDSALGARADRVRELLGAGARVAEGDPWARHAALTRGDPDAAVLRIGVRPSRLASLLASLPATAATAGLGTGVATVTVPAGAVADVHALVNAAGGTSVLRARPTGAHLPAWGPPPSAVAVLRAVKRAFDPDNRLGPGRFDPWM